LPGHGNERVAFPRRAFKESNEVQRALKGASPHNA
jgi:hypothetical protein